MNTDTKDSKEAFVRVVSLVEENVPVLSTSVAAVLAQMKLPQG